MNIAAKAIAVNNEKREIAAFEPNAAATNIAKANALADFAAKIRNWDLFEVAVEEKLQQQSEFVTWWRENVRGPGQSNSRRTGRIGAEEAEKQTQIRHQQVSKWSQRLGDREKYKAAVVAAAYNKAMAETNDTTAAKWTGDPESYTPSKYVEAARRAMGSIDVDPASNALAQETVKAGVWYDENTDGLKQDWVGNVFLNPPYSHPAIAHFIDKLCTSYSDGQVTSAVLLTNNNTDTKWWHLAGALASAVCFTAGRINFYKADGSVTQPTNGQNFFYFGPNPDVFLGEFSEFGMVMSVLKA